MKKKRLIAKTDSAVVATKYQKENDIAIVNTWEMFYEESISTERLLHMVANEHKCTDADVLDALIREGIFVEQKS